MVPGRSAHGGHVVVDAAVDEPSGDWTAPGVFSVAPGVHRIPLPLPTDGLRAVNVYAIEDGPGGELTLIDSGWAITESREALTAALAALGRGLGDVRRFLVTHVHQDHYTQAVALRREFGATVALGRGEQPTLDLVAGATPLRESPYLARLTAAAATGTLARLSALGRPKGDRSVWEAPDEWLADGATAKVGERELTAVATPGHTRGHLVFVDEAADLLFAGDHVLPHITPSIGFELAPADFPLRDFLASLRLVRSLPDRRLLPAHGPVTPSAHARIDALLEHHDRRLEEIFATVAAGADTAYASAAAMTWTRRKRTLAELDPFNEMMAVLETMSHLDVLVLQGGLVLVVDEGVRHYRLA
jgi:glyoxylase-like metal-dependent hydrolase (beta-lactamase superfamily II)